jgi:hypothetical protein
MKPRFLRWFALAAGLTIAAVAVWLFAPAREELERDFPLAIYFTCDTRGRLEPCGCFTGQHGGLTRLKTYMDSQPAEASLRFDVGDSIGGVADYDLVQYRYMLRAFAELRFDAINLGHREAQVNASALRDLATTSPVPLISANLLDAESGQPVVAPYRIVRRGAARIAIIGVVEPRGMRDRLGEGLRIEEIGTTLAALLPELRDRADLFVLLAFVDEGFLSSLAREFYEFDLILGGRVRQPAQNLIRENRSAIFFTTNEARTVAAMETEVHEGRRLQVIAAQVIFLDESIPEDEMFVALSDDYRKEIRRTRLALDDLAGLDLEQVPGVAPIATYVGTESCIGCHLQSHHIWERTGHAHAFASLQKKGADADPNCIGCHTVGLGTPSGYRREFEGRRLVNVGCESCHGPGSEHVTQRAAQRTSNEAVLFKYRKLTAADCTQCHYGEFSRPFEWDLFWPPIEH